MLKLIGYALEFDPLETERVLVAVVETGFCLEWVVIWMCIYVD